MLKFLFLFLESFLLKSFFKKEEYDIKSKEFNIFKLAVFAVLLSTSIMSIYFTFKLIKLYVYLNNTCPACLNGIR